MVILSFIERCVGFLEDKFSEDFGNLIILYMILTVELPEEKLLCVIKKLIFDSAFYS